MRKELLNYEENALNENVKRNLGLFLRFLYLATMSVYNIKKIIQNIILNNRFVIYLFQKRASTVKFRAAAKQINTEKNYTCLLYTSILYDV